MFLSIRALRRYVGVLRPICERMAIQLKMQHYACRGCNKNKCRYRVMSSTACNNKNLCCARSLWRPDVLDPRVFMCIIAHAVPVLRATQIMMCQLNWQLNLMFRSLLSYSTLKQLIVPQLTTTAKGHHKLVGCLLFVCCKRLATTNPSRCVHVNRAQGHIKAQP